MLLVNNQPTNHQQTNQPTQSIAVSLFTIRE